MNTVIALLAGVAGVLAGGVVNVLADDLPQRETLHRPHYADGAPRPPIAWLGLLALFSGRRTSPTGSKLSWRHPAVEASLGLLFALVTLAFPLDGQRMFYLLFLAILVLITVIDLEHRLILFVVIVPTCLLAVFESVLFPEPPPDLRDALIGGLVGFGIYFVIFLGGIAFLALTGTSEVAFGFGDVMLATLSGLLLGWRAFFLALVITVFLGAGGAVLYLASRVVLRSRYRLFTPIPYGPYIVLGTVIMLFWREEVRALLLP